MIRSRIRSDQLAVGCRSLLRPEPPRLTLCLCECVSGSVVAGARFLLWAVSHCEIESLRSANLILRGLILADLAPRVIITRPRAAAIALWCGWSLVFSTESPLLSVGLHVGVGGIVFSWAWLHLRAISLGEIVSLSRANSIFGRRFILCIYIWSVGTGTWDSGGLFFENFNRRFQTHRFWRTITPNNTFMVVCSRAWCGWSSVWRWSRAASELNIRSGLFDSFKVIKCVLSWSRHSCLFHWRLIEATLMTELRRLNIVKLSDIVHIVLTRARNSYCVSLVVEFQASIHCVILDSRRLSLLCG